MIKIVSSGVLTIAAFGAAVFFASDYFPDSKQNNSISPEAIITDLENLLAEAEKLKLSAGSDCTNKKDINQQINSLEKKLSELASRKKSWLDDKMAAVTEFIPPIPGSQVPDFDSPVPNTAESSNTEKEFIPPIPGSQVPDLDNPAPNTTDSSDVEFIPPIPGSEVPNLDDPVPNTTESKDVDWGYIPPIPGSEAPDLGGPSELETINILEQNIISELNSLKELCKDEEKAPIKKKGISDKCSDACQRHKDCAAYTEDVTPADLNDAYTTCMEECVTWPKETIKCINAVDIKTPGDCVSFVQCQLPQFYEEKYLKQ